MNASSVPRIMMVNTHATSGGAARMAATLAQALNDSGRAQAVLMHCGDRIKQHAHVGIRRPGSRPLNALLARVGGTRLVCDFGVSAELRRHMSAFDIVHLHNLHGYYLDWERLLEALQDKPVVWTWHDMWGATGRCGFSFECIEWTSGCGRCPHLNYYPATWIDQAAQEFRAKSRWLESLRRLVVVTPSSWLRDIAISRGIPSQRAFCTPNPVDVSAYRLRHKDEARQALGLNLHQHHLLFVAADCDNPRKGYRDFLEVVQTTGWRGLVAGGMPKQLPACVTYLGQFSDEAKLSVCYSAADALVVPSYFDNYPNTVIESMACGTPVFGYETGGIPSQMHPDIGGVVRVGGHQELSELIQRSLPGGKTVAHQQSLRAFALKMWAPAKVAEEYMTFYDAALSRI